MDKLKSIDSKLSAIRKELDSIAKDISNSKLEYSSANISNVGEALTAISDIQHSIYEQRPDLIPEVLKEHSKYPDFNRQFSRILIENKNLLSINEPSRALELLNKFVEKNPPVEFEKMAKNEVKRITKMFKI